MSTALEPTEDFLSEQEIASQFCQKCNYPLEDFAVCPSCGYYSKLAQFVDIDHQMEGFVDEAAEETEQPFRLPKWSYLTIAGSVAVIVEAMTLAILLPTNSVDRFACSLLHLIVGLVMVIVAQVRATFLTLMDDLDTNVVDCICSPPRTWGAVIRRLPESSWFFHLLCIGALSVLMSLLVLRTIPYGAIFGTEPAPKLKPSILQKVLGAASDAEESDESLQESLEALSEEEQAKKNAEEAISDETITARCTVIGYSVSGSDAEKVRTVVVATSSLNPFSKSRWRILGSVPVLDDELAVSMFSKLSQRVRETPVFPSELKATWVKPAYRCEVTYQEQGKERTPVNLELTKVH